MSSDFGKNIKVTVFGSSHGPNVGVSISGLAEGETIDCRALAAFLARRKPGTDETSSSRKEEDIPVFVSGTEITDDENTLVCTGGIVTAIIENTDVKRSDYADLHAIPRPGHADFGAYARFGAAYDMSGGSDFSGRMTAPLCIAGGIAKQLLARRGIAVTATLTAAGNVRSDNPEVLKKEILRVKQIGDSCSGEVRITASNVPAGYGGSMFDGLESAVSGILFGIPAVKSVSFGTVKPLGSENNDPFFTCSRETAASHSADDEDLFSQIKTKTNNHGGILGGITTGMPVEITVVFKPTPSIPKPQDSVDLLTGEPRTVTVGGRHDPCVALRAIPACESALALALLDILAEPLPRVSDVLEIERQKIDTIDLNILKLFSERLASAERIAAYKKEHGLPVYMPEREKALFERIAKLSDERTAPYSEELFRVITSASKSAQQEQTINTSEKKCALVGGRLSYSYSKEIHEALGLYSYEMIEAKPEKLPALLADKSYTGFSVTNPYKRAVIPLCDELTDSARELGAVNTLFRKEDRLIGDNTDAPGFLYGVSRLGVSFSGKRVLVLGDGATSGTITACVRSQGPAKLEIATRKPDMYIDTEHVSYDDIDTSAEIIINATPVGTYPDTEGTLIDLENFSCCEAVFDVVYNPLRTKLIAQAKALGLKCSGGLPMLVAQAIYAAARFAGKDFDPHEAEALIEKLSIEKSNIVIIGMPGSGKTTYGRLLAKATGRTFADLDEITERQTGMTIPEIFEKKGEAGFRIAEKEAAEALKTLTNAVIACGGGAVTNPETMDALIRRGFVLFLDCPLEALATKGRPLSKEGSLEKLFEERKALYERYKDLKISISF